MARAELRNFVIRSAWIAAFAAMTPRLVTPAKAGVQNGAPCVNRALRADGSVETLDHIGQTQMQPGDVFEIHTPGGGGYGASATEG